MSFWTTVVVEFSVAIRTEGAKKMAQVNHSTMKPGNHRIHHPLFKQNANSSVVQTLGDNAINNVFLAMLVLAWLTPTLMLFVSSFRPVADMMTTGWWTAFLRPGRFTVENYQVVLASKGIVNNFMNSLIITIPATVLPICIGALAAYPISFYKFPGRKLIFVGLIAFGLPLCVYIFRNFFAQMPYSLIEAAKIDGANNFTIFKSLIVPMSKPAFASLAIFQFLWVWSDMLVALVVLGDPNLSPLTVKLTSLMGSLDAGWQVMTPAAFTSMLLPLIVFLAFQKQFVRGILAGSVKG